MEKLYCFLKIILGVTISLLLVISLWQIGRINQKVALLMNLQKISQLPTGETSLAVLGPPSKIYDGQTEFEKFAQYTDFKHKDFFNNKKIYMWPMMGILFANYIYAVIDKDTDEIIFTSSQSL